MNRNNSLGIASGSNSSPLERGLGVCHLFFALLALFFSSCEANEALPDQSADVPLSLGASIAQASVMTRADGDLTIGAGGEITLIIDNVEKSFTPTNGGRLVPDASDEPFMVSVNTNKISVEARGTIVASGDNFSGAIPVVPASSEIEIVWTGDRPTATIAFIPATTRMTVDIYAADGATELSSFQINGSGLTAPAIEDGKYMFDNTGILLGEPAKAFAEGTSVQLIPFEVADDATLFTVEDTNASGPYAGKTYTVKNTSGDTFRALAGKHYLVTVTLQADDEPIAFITEISATWNVQPEKEVLIATDYDMVITDHLQLQQFAERVNKGETSLRALQVADITMDWPIKPIGIDDKFFTGVYNGNGYTINNYVVETNSAFTGLFGKLGPGAVLTGIRLNRASITSTKSLAALLAGSALGSAEKSIIISLCEASGTVVGTNFLGGLVGEASHTHISRSHVDVELTGTSSMLHAGGIIARLTSGSVFACSANATITGANTEGYDSIGGLVGELSDDNAKIAFSYSTGSILSNSTHNNYIGGLVGNLIDGTVTRSYTSVRINPKKTTGTVIYIGALVGNVFNNASLTYSNADLAASGLSVLTSSLSTGTVENCSSTPAKRAETVGATLTDNTGGIVYQYSTVWNTNGYRINPTKKVFYPRNVWINAQSPAINYGYNGAFTIG